MTKTKIRMVGAVAFALAMLASAATAQTGSPPPLPASVLAEDVDPAKVDYLRSHVVASGPVTGPFRFDLPAAFYSNRLFLVGESHGSAAPHLFDLALFEDVARRTGLRDYLAECDPVQGAAFDRYVQTGEDAALRRVFDYWSSKGSQWGSQSYEDKIRGLRAVALRLQGAPVRVRGLDAIQDWSMTLDWLQAHNVAFDRAAIEAAAAGPAKAGLLLATLPPTESGEDETLAALRVALEAQAANRGREGTIVASYAALATGVLQNKPAYGMWGLAHVLQEPLKSGAPFAAQVEQSSLPSAGRIASIILVPIESTALYAVPQGEGFVPMRVDTFNVTGPLVKMDGSADLVAAAPSAEVTVYDLAGPGSPYIGALDFIHVTTSIRQDFEPGNPTTATPEYARYLGVVRGSDWAGARTGATPPGP
jgi:hypothetical protein